MIYWFHYSREKRQTKNKHKMDAGNKKNNAGGSWVAGFAKTCWRFWL